MRHVLRGSRTILGCWAAIGSLLMADVAARGADVVKPAKIKSKPAMMKPDSPPPPTKSKPANPKKLVRRTSSRDPAAVAAQIDRLVANALTKANVPASPPADDAEFVRRVTLDLTGRIPTWQQAAVFLDDPSPTKRREWIESLTAGRASSEHFARLWRKLIAPPDLTSAKYGVDRFSPWLVEQFDANRPWSAVAVELLTADADPTWAFYRANSSGTTPQPNLLAAAAGRIFLGVQIGCAECHNHPFAPWTQEDFWSQAAFFGRLRTKAKGDFSLTEIPTEGSATFADAVITLPEGAGKATGKIVAAQFLNGSSPRDVALPLRPQWGEWLTARDNPYFARATVNRLWSWLFGRGLVHPVDDFRTDNDASHPEVLQLLADEFIAADFDIEYLLRCICLSEAYQRSSLPTPGNERDETLLSRRIVRPLSPDQLYDALHTSLGATATRPLGPGGKPPFAKPLFAKTGGMASLGPRDPFVRSFLRTAEEGPADEFGYGIPQLLRLLNGSELNTDVPLVADLVAYEKEPRRRLETLFLVAYARRPTAAELSRLESRLDERGRDAVPTYAGLLWSLLNSSEFLLNH